MEFDYGIVEYKNRFNLSRSLDDYEVTVLYGCICICLQYKYKTMAHDKLVAEVQIVHRIDGKHTECVKLDLHDKQIRIVHKGDMSIVL